MIQYKILPDDFSFANHKMDDLQTAFEMEADIFHEGGVIKWNGKIWHPISATCSNPQGPIDVIGLREHTDCKEILTEEAEDIDCEGNITCPFCKSAESDSWVDSESEDDFECRCCGGRFSYEREISVSYSMKPLQAPPVYEPKPRRLSGADRNPA